MIRRSEKRAFLSRGNGVSRHDYGIRGKLGHSRRTLPRKREKVLPGGHVSALNLIGYASGPSIPSAVPPFL